MICHLYTLVLFCRCAHRSDFDDSKPLVTDACKARQLHSDSDVDLARLTRGKAASAVVCHGDEFR